MSEDSAISGLCESIESLADWLETVNQHIAEQDFLKARRMIWKVVSMKVQLNHAKSLVENLPDLPQEELTQWVTRLRTGTNRLTVADGLLEDQINQVPLLTDDPDNAQELGEVAQYMLPDEWELTTDIFVLVGRSCIPLAKELIKAGQLRVFCLVSENIELEEADYVLAHNEKQLMDALDALGGDPPQRAITQMVDTGCGDTNFAEDIGNRVYMKMLDLRAQMNTVDQFGTQWVTNVVNNFGDIPRAANIHVIGDHFAGKPLVVISTGPSLSKNIDQLKALKGKAILLALNHSLSAMHKANIMPDLAIALEAQDLTYHFEGFPIEKIAGLAVSATVRNNLFQLPTKRLLAFSGGNLVDNWAFQCMNESPQLNSGGSVANNALSLALMWKCDPVIFVGQDLALTDGQFYAKTCVDGDMAIEMSDGGRKFRTTNFTDGYRALDSIKGKEKSGDINTITVPGYYGGTVLTTGPLNLYRRWFETMASRHQETTQMWNCTEGGARIDGMEHIPLSEAIERIQGQQVDVESTLDAIWAEINWDERRQLMLAGGEELLKSMTRCIQLAKRCRTLADKARFNPSSLQKLQTSEMELVKELQPIVFISQIQNKLIRETMKKIGECEDMREMLLYSKDLYQIVLEAEDDLANPLRKSLQKLKAPLA